MDTNKKKKGFGSKEEERFRKQRRRKVLEAKKLKGFFWVFWRYLWSFTLKRGKTI